MVLLTSSTALRCREFDDVSKPSNERLIDILLSICRKDRDAFVTFQSEQQVTDLHVGITIVAIADPAAFPEKSIGLVEKENGPGLVRGGKYSSDILLGLADVFADDRREINAIEIGSHLLSNNLCCQGFAGSLRTHEQRGSPRRSFQSTRLWAFGLSDDFLKDRPARTGQREVFPLCLRYDLTRTGDILTFP